jgi:hypothetical protein
VFSEDRREHAGGNVSKLATREYEISHKPASGLHRGSEGLLFARYPVKGFHLAKLRCNLHFKTVEFNRLRIHNLVAARRIELPSQP